MRDPDRLDSFYAELCKLHKKEFPDLRFGQLCVNFFSWLQNEQKDPFFPEEEMMLQLMNRYVSEMKTIR